MDQKRVIPQCPKCRSEGRIFKKLSMNGNFYDYQCRKCYHLYNIIKPTASRKGELYKRLNNDELESATAHKLKINLNPEQKGTESKA